MWMEAAQDRPPWYSRGPMSSNRILQAGNDDGDEDKFVT